MAALVRAHPARAAKEIVKRNAHSLVSSGIACHVVVTITSAVYFMCCRGGRDATHCLLHE